MDTGPAKHDDVLMAQLFETDLPRDVTGYARIALEQGIDFSATGLTYAIPETLADLCVGQRVIVPLGRGNKQTHGYVISLESIEQVEANFTETKLNKIKAVESRDDSGISLTEDLIQLAVWMAGYYCCPIGMVLATMLPAAVKHGTGRVLKSVVRLANNCGNDDDVNEIGNDDEGQVAETSKNDNVEKLEEADKKEKKKTKLTALQQKVLDTATRLKEEGQQWTELRDLADLAGAKTTSPIKQLVTKGFLVEGTKSDVRAFGNALDFSDADTNGGSGGNGAAGTKPADLKLTEEQNCALDHISKEMNKGFHVNLLHGVTGSGKTEVYLRAIEQLNDEPDGARSGAIVLVPEIALTPQTVGRFHERFGDQVAVLHSGLTAAQRHEQWRRIRKKKVRIVVGARSAIFAPLENLGLIIVDEEHESSYKQDQLPRYHARDVAIKRAQLLGVPVILGSATPSLESYFNATTKHSYQYLPMTHRVAAMKLPKVEIVDLTDERRKRYEMTGRAGVHLLSIRLEHALKQTIKNGGQAMLLLNRRGYANYIACPDHKCGWRMNCEFCDAMMVYHKSDKLPTGGFVHCHHCTATQTLPPLCPDCGKKVTVFGLGTQRVEEELERKFSDINMMRMDSDSMRTSHDYQDTLKRFRQGEINLLVGTQMIAKGLDFPNVRLVGVISGDTSLHMPDFRASERTFQLIAQVAGRAGRSSEPGLVIVQTFNPHDIAITLASQHDYESFAKQELQVRSEMGLPPVTRMARIVVRNRDHLKASQQVSAIHQQLTQTNESMQLKVRIRPPAPCPIARIAEHYRIQIELIGPDAGSLQKLLTALRNARMVKSDHHTAVDVDPVTLL